MGGKTGTTTSSVQIPPEVLARYNAVNAQAQKTAATPFQQYSTDPNAFVAPLNEQQQAGINNINQQANAAQPGYQAGMNTTGSAINQINAGQNVAQPYFGGAQTIAAGAIPQYQQAAGLAGAAMTPLQQATYAAQPGYQAAQAGTMAAGAGTGQTIGQLGNISQGYNAPNYQAGVAGYMNPFLQNAMGSTAAMMQNQNQQQQNQLQGNAISSGAFGGDRGNIAQAALMGQQNLAMGQTLGQMANTGYQSAAQNYMSGLGAQAGIAGQQGAMYGQMGNLANQYGQLGGQAQQALINAGQAQQAGAANIANIAGQGMNAAGQYGALGTAAQNAALQGVPLSLAAGAQQGALGAGAQTAGLQGAQAQVGAGTLGQQTTQAGLSALYNQFQQQQAYPFQVSQFLANIAEGTGALSGSTTTTTGPQSWFSDARLKEDIKQVGTAKNGLPIYNFKYKGDPTEQTHIGYMAQDVEKVHPEAVGESNGFKTVNYEQASKPVHRASGGAANSEGGVVAPQHAAEGYFNGGDVVSPYDLSAILAAQKESYAPFQQGGIYGGQSGGTPGGKSYVPSASLAVPHLGVANPARAQQGDTLMGDVQQATSGADTVKKAYGYGQDIIGHPATAAKAAIPASGDTAAQAAVAAQPSTGAYGVIDWLKSLSQPQASARGGVIGYADGGSVDPYQTDDPMSQVVSDTEKDKGQHGLMTAQNPTGQSSSTLGDISKIAAIPGEISGLGTMASAVGSGVGAAASGIGSFLSSLGPFALALKDGGVVPREHHATLGTVGGTPDDTTAPDATTIPDDYALNASKELLRQREGLLTNAKYDVNAYRTGYGSDTVTQPDGTVVPVKADTSITKDDAERDLARRTGITQQDIQSKIGADTWGKLTPDARVALTSTAYNYGSLPDAVVAATKSGNASDIATAINNLGGENEGVNAVRRSKEASLIDPQGKYDPMAPQPKQALTAPGSNAAAAPTSIGDWISKKAQDPDVLLSVLAGLGSMAGSNSRYLGAAILQGIGGGAEMYKGLQQQGIERQRVGIEGLKANADVQAKNLEVLKYYQGNFTPALNATGQKIYRNKLTGEEVSPEQYNAIMSGVAGQVTSGGGVGGASSVALGAPPAGGVVPPAATPTPPPAGTATQAPAATTASQPPPMAISDSDIAAHQTDYNWLMQNAQKLRNQAQTFVGVNKDQQDLLENRANDMQKRAGELMNTPQATPLGSQYVIRPGYNYPKDTPPAPIDETTPRGQLDPNTGKIISAPPKSRDIGFHSTGGFYPDTYPPNALPIENGDARVMAQKAAQAGTQQDFETAAQGTQTGISSIIKFATAAQQLESKGLNMTKAEYSNMLRGLGLGSAADMVENQQDDAAAYTATKAALDSAISTSNAAFSKPTQSEFGTIAEKGSPNIDAPVDTSHSLAQTRLAGFLWQQQLYHDWKQDQQTQGVSNFGSYLDRWKALHPSSMFEDSADRLLGNFKGQDLPNNNRFAEGVTYVVPDKASNNPSSEAIRQYAIDQGLKPGDIFTVNGVKHNQDGSGSFFKIKKIDPKDAYRTHLSAPGLQYGN